MSEESYSSSPSGEEEVVTTTRSVETKVGEVQDIEQGNVNALDNVRTQTVEMSQDNCYDATEDSDTEDERGNSSDRVGFNHIRCGSRGNCAIEIEIPVEKAESDIGKQCENPAVNDGISSANLPSDLQEDRDATAESASVCIEMNELIEASSAEPGCNVKSPSEGTTCFTTASDAESTDLESDVCRICHCGEEVEVLISPCLCTGSVKFVHHTCLMSWLQRVVMSKCELCLYPLAVKRKRKSLSKWRLPEDKPFPILWLFTFVVAMTLNIASIAKDGSQRCVSNPCIIFYVLGSAGALLGLAFFYHWLRKTIRYLAKWVALNEEWSLAGPTDLRSQIGQTNLAFSTKSLPDAETTQVEVA